MPEPVGLSQLTNVYSQLNLLTDICTVNEVKFGVFQRHLAVKIIVWHLLVQSIWHPCSRCVVANRVGDLPCNGKTVSRTEKKLSEKAIVTDRQTDRRPINRQTDRQSTLLGL